MTAREPIEILKDIRKLLADEERWCKGAMAKNGAGLVCHHKDSSAQQWCLAGARLSLAGCASAETHKRLRAACGGSSEITFNDDPTTTHADILRVLDEAIAKAIQ